MTAEYRLETTQLEIQSNLIFPRELLVHGTTIVVHYEVHVQIVYIRMKKVRIEVIYSSFQTTNTTSHTFLRSALVADQRQYLDLLLAVDHLMHHRIVRILPRVLLCRQSGIYHKANENCVSSTFTQNFYQNLLCSHGHTSKFNVDPTCTDLFSFSSSSITFLIRE